jgi:hypothetical protein
MRLQPLFGSLCSVLCHLGCDWGLPLCTPLPRRLGDIMHDSWANDEAMLPLKVPSASWRANKFSGYSKSNHELRLWPADSCAADTMPGVSGGSLRLHPNVYSQITRLGTVSKHKCRIHGQVPYVPIESWHILPVYRIRHIRHTLRGNRTSLNTVTHTAQIEPRKAFRGTELGKLGFGNRAGQCGQGYVCASSVALRLP